MQIRIMITALCLLTVMGCSTAANENSPEDTQIDPVIAEEEKDIYPVIDNPFLPQETSMVNIWQTNGDESKKLVMSQIPLNQGQAPQENRITIQPDVTYQIIEGFGAALTDSSAYLIYNHPQRDETMETLQKASTFK
ncbi:MAG: hypothetical protein PF447_13050 [Spirochaetaceae bacterium]|jgi:O-glycosyl hydrolase|nr:hypothetical protein [Spirochaetaceae bacterium]